MAQLIAEFKLKRFLLYGSEDIVYIPGNRLHYFQVFDGCLASLRTLLNQVDLQTIFSLVKRVQNEKLASHIAIVPLVLSECSKISGWVEKTLEFALTVLRTDKEFLLFCKFCYEILPDIGVGPLVMNFIQNWYASWNYWELAEMLSEKPSFHGWCHRDVIRMGSVIFSNPTRAAVITYAFGGVELLDELFANDVEAKEVVDHLKRVDAFKNETDPDKAVTEIGAYTHTIHTINKSLLQHRRVWKALIKQMDLVELLDRLPIIRKNGFLRCPLLDSRNNHFETNLCDRLESLGAVLQSKISPSKSCIEHERWKNNAELACRNFSNPKPTVKEDVLQSLKVQMENALKKNVAKCWRNITVIIDCYNLPRCRCSHKQFVQADIAAAVAALHFGKASTVYKVLVFRDPVVEYLQPTDTIEDVVNYIGVDPPVTPSTRKICSYLSPINRDIEDTDLFVVIGVNVNYDDYMKTVDDHRRENPRSPKFAFCSLGGIRSDRQYKFEQDVIITTGFDDKMCHIVTGFAKL